MEKNDISSVIITLRKDSPKRNFPQTVDLVINLRGLDLKKPEEKVELFVPLPHSKGKKITVCAFLDQTLAVKAKGVFDKIITKEEFASWNGKKAEQKRLASAYDYFVAQADLMAPLAATFGKVLGPKGKMPNPKAGCVFPGTIPHLAPIKDKLATLARLQTKGELSIKTSVGVDSMNDDAITDNVLAVYNTLLTKLPQEENNVKNVGIKFTMGPLFRIIAIKANASAKVKK